MPMTHHWRATLRRVASQFPIHRLPFRLLADFTARRYRPDPVPDHPRVLHVTPQYFADESYIGGGERYALELARAMADCTKTRIVSFGDRRRTLQYGRAKFDVYSLRGRLVSRDNPFAHGFLSALHNADVIHCHQFHYRVIAVTILMGAMLHKPIFVTDLGGSTSALSDTLRLSRHVCQFLSLTRYVENLTGVAGRSTVIYGGVDTGRFSPPDAPIARDHVLYVGRLLPHKGIDILVRAAGDDIPLTIVGRPYDHRYYRELQRLAHGRSVQFIINADDAQLRHLYRRAMAIVLPSVYTDMYGKCYHGKSEYLGLTLLEGMACGAPAICTDVGGMPEIVRDGVTGFVVPPNDPAALRARLLQLRDNPDLVATMGDRAAREVRANYTWDKVAERCLTAYQQYAGPQTFSPAREPMGPSTGDRTGPVGN